MVRSMTAFGRGELTTPTHEIVVEIRSVNHRYFEFSCKTPRAYGYLDEKLKGFLQSKIARGKVEAYVSIRSLLGKDAQLVVNEQILEHYISTLRRLGKTFKLKDNLSTADLLSIPDLFDMRKPEEDEDAITESVLQAAQLAVDKFTAMREREGENLKADVLNRLVSIEHAVAIVEENSEETIKAYRERLYAKIQEVLQDRQMDEQRVLTEVAIFSDKVAVDEETVRLKSHLAQMRSMLEETVPVGRKLDFLIQEFNREANTIGSKAQNMKTAQVVVEIKSDIEKIREQIQNIE